MTRQLSSSEALPAGFRVEAPKVGDAIGRALRGAYERDPALPDDMIAILRRLNGATCKTP